MLSTVQHQAPWRNPKKPSAVLHLDGGDMITMQDLWLKTMWNNSLSWGNGSVSCTDFTWAQELAVFNYEQKHPESVQVLSWNTMALRNGKDHRVSESLAPAGERPHTPSPHTQSGTHWSHGRRSPSLLSQLCWWLHICTKLTHLPLG